MIYLILDAVYNASYCHDELIANEAMDWLFTTDNTKLGFDWWCNLIGLNPKWTRQQLFQDMSFFKNGRDRGAGRLSNLGLM